MTDDTRNLILAIGMSLLVIIGWNYFFAKPTIDSSRQNQARIETTPTPPAASPTGAPTAGPDALVEPNVRGAAPPPVQSRETVIASTPRVAIDTPNLRGSINLQGGRIDDISLKAYRETPDPSSPEIVLLAPIGSEHPYVVGAGFIPQGETQAAVPTPASLWVADSDKLTPDKPVTLSFDNGQGLIFRRQISVDNEFMFTLRDSVENRGGGAVTLAPYTRALRIGKPKTDNYAVLHEGFVGVVGDSRVQEITYDAIEKETKATRTLAGTGGWIGFTDKYWAVALAPEQDRPLDASFSSSGDAVKTYQTALIEKPVTVEPGATSAFTTHIFAGAKVTKTIDAYQAQLGIKNFDLIIDWGWFYFITKPLFWIIDFIYRFVGNFGVAILAVTVLVKAAFFPLANRSYLSMAKMKAVQPQMKALQERYPDDKAKQQQELMELYKREKINPVAGCLPILIQIPVFFALYKVIFITIEMRQAPFFGWIRDLSSPDPTNLFTLFGLIPYNPTTLPVIGSFLHLGIWPLIMGVSMFVQMKMNPEPTDPVQKQMFAWMPVIFTFMLGSFPAGLVIYWTWNNTLSVIQQSLIMKRAGVKIELWDNLTNMFARKRSA